jgi:type II secretory pathway component PulK
VYFLLGRKWLLELQVLLISPGDQIADISTKLATKQILEQGRFNLNLVSTVRKIAGMLM